MSEIEIHNWRIKQKAIQQIEDAAHVQRLVEYKRQARAHRACDRLAQAAPASAELLKQAIRQSDLLVVHYADGWVLSSGTAP